MKILNFFYLVIFSFLLFSKIGFAFSLIELDGASRGSQKCACSNHENIFGKNLSLSFNQIKDIVGLDRNSSLDRERSGNKYVRKGRHLYSVFAVVEGQRGEGEYHSPAMKYSRMRHYQRRIQRASYDFSASIYVCRKTDFSSCTQDSDYTRYLKVLYSLDDELRPVKGVVVSKKSNLCLPPQLRHEMKGSTYTGYATWNDLNFAIDDPHYYNYSYTSPSDSSSSESEAHFTARAWGQLNSDSCYSVFERVGPIVTGGGVAGGSGLYKHPPLE